MMLVGQQEGHPACKNSITTMPQKLLLGTGLTCNNLNWNNSGKMCGLNKNRRVTVCVSVCDMAAKTLNFVSEVCTVSCVFIIILLKFDTLCTPQYGSQRT